MLAVQFRGGLSIRVDQESYSGRFRDFNGGELPDRAFRAWGFLLLSPPHSPAAIVVIGLTRILKFDVRKDSRVAQFFKDDDMGSNRVYLATAMWTGCFLLAGCQVFSGGSPATLGRLSPFNRLPSQSEPDLRDMDALEPSIEGDDEDSMDISAFSPQETADDRGKLERQGHRPLPVTESRPAITEDQAAVPKAMPAG